MTSHDVIDRLRKLTGQRTIGHTGTLDPLAEGLMIVCLGSATKLADQLTSARKRYDATIVLGISSQTYDAEGVSASTAALPVPYMTLPELESIVDRFRGEFEQTVPPHSAVQVNGRRLYDLARAGKAIDLPKRTVTIDELTVAQFESPEIRLHVCCSKGTYIRSLAHDIGQAIGCGGYLSRLRRTEVGKHRVVDAFTLEQLQLASSERRLDAIVRPSEEIWDSGSVRILPRFETHFAHGRSPSMADLSAVDRPFGIGDRVMIKRENGRMIGLGTASGRSTDEQADRNAPLFQAMKVLI